jgi:hypothetical protein
VGKEEKTEREAETGEGRRLEPCAHAATVAEPRAWRNGAPLARE